ncbi:MAG TPA: penicillin-binding protein 2 [Solirubrobacterales bacterium]|jgi:penicillin-binding protein 2|nr:penicillin-binding protein 2 [Solirubrobacterales bacterium]
MFRHDENAAPTHAQFAMRVAILGGIGIVAFAAIFFRLWFLEVLSGEAYLKEANANRVREIKIQAPRGEILDRAGRVLVDNKTVLSLQVRADELPHDKQARNKELKKLAGVANMPYDKIKQEIRQQTKELPANPVTLQQDVDKDLVYYLRERQDEFPGVTASQVYVRDYPNGTLGAQLFGYVSEIGPDQLKEPAYEGLEPGDRIGATGLEAQYDPILRGRNGAIRVQVDASGKPSGRELSRIEPEAGDNLKLTLDKKVQATGESALASSGLPGAFVAMNVRDGSILGLGSAPTFDPSVFTPPVKTDVIENLANDEENPLLDRAIQAGYPTGSTFKAVTGSAALEAGLVTPEHTFNDTGSFEFGDYTWRNAGEAPNGVVDMVSALRVSSDVFFYDIGRMANDVYDETGQEIIQDWAKQLGFGALTGIDVPGEGAGLLPTPEWRDKLFKEASSPNSCGGKKVLYGVDGCYETDRGWSVGDNMNLAVGQGDLQATPLQLATAYAAIGNGGEVVRPHLGMEAEDPSGAQTQAFEPAPRREVDLSGTTRSTIMEGLREAAMEPGGTSYPTFGGYPVDIAGKTGTAEKTNQEDQSWYAALAPADNPKFVVVFTIERGGFGAERAAPAACQVLNVLLDVKSQCVAGTSQTR